MKRLWRIAIMTCLPAMLLNLAGLRHQNRDGRHLNTLTDCHTICCADEHPGADRHQHDTGDTAVD